MAPKPKAIRPKTEEKSQGERFIEAARQIGADETGQIFEDALKKIISHRPDQKAHKSGKKTG